MSSAAALSLALPNQPAGPSEGLGLLTAGSGPGAALLGWGLAACHQPGS